MTTQYRVVVAKNDERIDGPNDADVMLSVPVAVAVDANFDATVEYMRGRLKAVGHTASVLAELKSGEATMRLSQLASQL